MCSLCRLDLTAAGKEAFFCEVKQCVTGSHGLDVQFSGINFLESLVSEFSPSTSSAMGLPREFHEQCRASLELDYLKAFYCWAQEAALSVTSRIIESDSAELESGRGEKQHRCFSAGVRQDSNSLRAECTLVQPGPSWHDVLISSGHIGWLLNFYGALRQKFSREGYWLDCPIAVSARKLIVQFCSLTGTIFPSGIEFFLVPSI
ncbi:unnamed protein product [Ilex paraguariensis]|uniref:Uncharacterized protein n=1 Tax=Ilex paraguariensis TaxID=185542 RepID=A0ABC8TAA8_9AQUA